MNRKKQSPKMTGQARTNRLYREVRAILEQARSSAYRAVNAAMVQAYWQIGRVIVEHEQGGKKRAKYGETVLEGLSKRLTAEFGSGFDARNLRYMRQFYLLFPIWNAVRSKSERAAQSEARTITPDVKDNRNAMRSDSADSQIRDALRHELSWTHYRLLLGVEDADARLWYMHEAADQRWSYRQLERQISTLYYERLRASRDKGVVRHEASAKLKQVEPEQFIHDPYVLEFLNLKDYPGLRESDLESPLIGNLQMFLLELGSGFAFVGRQVRLTLEGDHFYADLVFYHVRLKCYVIIDLKVGKLTHGDLGQMQMYVNYFDREVRSPEDNPTVGLILCARKNDAVVRYVLGEKDKQIFASRYKLELPSEEVLQKEIERERRQIETNPKQEG